MMSSDAKYRARLDRLADDLQRAREAQQQLPPGAERERRACELDALERQQDAVRRTLALPSCRQRAQQAIDAASSRAANCSGNVGTTAPLAPPSAPGLQMRGLAAKIVLAGALGIAIFGIAAFGAP